MSKLLFFMVCILRRSAISKGISVRCNVRVIKVKKKVSKMSTGVIIKMIENFNLKNDKTDFFLLSMTKHFE